MRLIRRLKSLFVEDVEHLKATSLEVNEIFGITIQGEGASAGKEVVFLRLANCNISCQKCDTDFTWRFDDKHPHVNNVVYKREDEIHKMSLFEIRKELYKKGTVPVTTLGVAHSFYVKALVVSGGEPLMQQKRLAPLLMQLKKEGWWIEIETNGTLVPRRELVDTVDQINCSPKLDSTFSGESLKRRIREGALKALASEEKTHFKFVISEKENMTEALELIQRFGMKTIYLMPEGRVLSEIQEKKPWVEALAKEYGLRFSTRLHVELWGNKRAV